MTQETRQKHRVGWPGLWAALVVLMQALPAQVAAEERNGMVLVPAGKAVVGTTDAERRELAKRFDCHATWLNDDLPRHEVALPAFWIDRYPVTNAQYLAFIEATGQARPTWWGRWGGVFPATTARSSPPGGPARAASLPSAPTRSSPACTPTRPWR